MRKEVTMSDIAKKLGVSTVTVSKALSDKPGVSLEIREKIKSIATELGYSYVSGNKAIMDATRTNNIGVIIPELFIGTNEAYYWELYKKIVDELGKINNYAIFELLKKEDENSQTVPKMVLDNKVDGLIVLGQVCRKYFNMIKSVPVPVVFMDFYENDMHQDFIISDNFYTMYQLTNHLVELGHRRIGFLGNKRATSSIQDRYLGYIKALIENNLEQEGWEDWYIEDRDDNGVYIDYELPENLPTAYVCNNDKMAYELIQRLQLIGKKVPEDISIVGFDNFNPTTEISLGLTTAEVDTRAMAQTGIDVLMKRIQNGKGGKGIRQVGCRILIRDSAKHI